MTQVALVLHKNSVCFPMGDQHWSPLIKMFQNECFEAQI